GPLAPLVGKWEGKSTGWNMIALPFKDSTNPKIPYRILMNQYDEKLDFSTVGDKIPNRGISEDQEVATLDYQQVVTQINAEDFPDTRDNPNDPDDHGQAGPPGSDIHHEPGLWIFVKDGEPKINGINIARLASIPHGNSVLATGISDEVEGMPEIPGVNALPFGRFESIDQTPPDEYDFRDPADEYLSPYKHYIDHPFMGTAAGFPGFPGFSPRDMNQILNFANQGVDIVKTTVLNVDSTREHGGIKNMPFVQREAEPVSMRSTFWIQQLREKDNYGNPKLRLQYSQIVMLDFFPNREDQMPGRAQWPHISINTLEKVGEYPNYPVN
ncbi:MAG: heme-binding protein, partial [Paracoccaceae bacterium]